VFFERLIAILEGREMEDFLVLNGYGFVLLRVEDMAGKMWRNA